MGLLLGYVLGRQRERPNVEWAHELDAHADELTSLIEELREELSVLENAVVASRRVVPLLRPNDDGERQLVADFMDALEAAEVELLGDI